LGPDGNLRVALMVGNRYPGNGNTFGTLWVGTVSTNGELLSSWSDESFGPWEVNALAVDPAGNLYLAGEGAWKYSPDGKRIGCIGGWGGTGDQRDAPGSLVNCAAAVDIDATGHLRVLDSLPHYSPTGAPVMAANHLLMFAYTQSSFTDVPYWHWAKDAIGSLTKAGLAAGYPDGTYHPAEALTRDQMAVYISRALAGGDDKVPAFTGAPSFSDVGADNWALKYVQ
jgi:hypothetical protein